MKKLMISSLIGLAALVAALGLFSGSALANGTTTGPTGCTLSAGVTQHGKVIIGTNGRDTILCGGTSVGVIIIGLNAVDRIEGSEGDDLIFGGNGGDSLFGNGGNDTLDGGRGRDFCNGGGQAGDTFRACEVFPPGT